jgi:DNA-binding HxlR family transcriptional regulator
VERADDGYRLSARGAELAEVVMLMARWAADWQPPDPRDRPDRG